jgi:hypothetical protein
MWLNQIQITTVISYFNHYDPTNFVISRSRSYYIYIADGAWSSLLEKETY